MAPILQPTRASKRIAEMKKKAAESEATATSKTAINKPKRKRAKRGPTTGKVTKAKKKAPIAHVKKLRYFITTDQHTANHQARNWVDGQVCVAADGQKVPEGSIVVVIKVPSGMEFLLFPKVLKLVDSEEGQEMEEEIEQETEELTVEQSESELSECGYISDVHF